MSSATPISERPRIVKFATVSISIQGIQIRDFKTENTPGEGDLPKVVIDWAIDRLAEGRKLFGPSPRGVLKYTDAIRRSLSAKNWFGALFLSLAMPDICGVLEAPTDSVGTRYK